MQGDFPSNYVEMDDDDDPDNDVLHHQGEAAPAVRHQFRTSAQTGLTEEEKRMRADMMKTDVAAVRARMATLGLGEVVDLCSPATLKPVAIKVAGPLIRVVGDRFAAPVKAGCMHVRFVRICSLVNRCCKSASKILWSILGTSADKGSS